MRSPTKGVDSTTCRQPPKSEIRGPKPERRPNTEGRSHARAFRFVFLRLHAKWLQFITAGYAKYAESRGGRSVFPCIPRIPRLLFPSFGSGLARLGLRVSAFFRPSFSPRISGFGFGALRSRVGGSVQIRPLPGSSTTDYWPGGDSRREAILPSTFWI
jgi:hypothetical protein